MKEKKRAVVYCRVSTKEQVEEGNSLITQEKYCREYANKNEYEIVQVFIEMGESAKTADRTELQKMMKFCAEKNNKISVVIAYKIDRISRNTDDYSQIRIMLKRYGVEIKSTSEFFEDTPAGRFMENIIANVAQFDNEVRTERSVGGMKQAVLEGRYVWMAPFGYANVKVNGKSTIAPNDYANILKEIFNYIAVQECSAEKARQHFNEKYKLSFVRSVFYLMLKNPIYISKIKKFGMVVDGNFEPLVSEALFYKVQQIITRKYKAKKYVKENPDFPLRRFIKCENGLSISGGWSAGRLRKYPYYRMLDTGKLIAKEALEGKFVEYLNSFSVDAETIKSLEKIVTEKLRNSTSLILSNKTTLQKQFEEIKQQRRLLLEKNITGIIADDLLKEHMEILDKKLWDVQDKISKADDRPFDIEYVFSRLHKMLINPGNYWQEQPPQIKVLFQWFKFPEGIVFDGMHFRTQKVHSIFMLKKDILENLSFNVHHLGRDKKHHYFANSPASVDEGLFALFREVQNDLITYEEKVNEVVLQNAA